MHYIGGSDVMVFGSRWNVLVYDLLSLMARNRALTALGLIICRVYIVYVLDYLEIPIVSMFTWACCREFT